MSDTARFTAFLAERRYEGLHSGEVRRLGISGNPSQRAKDAVTKGTGVFKAAERNGRRPGTRFWLSAYAPDFAVPVQPNRSSDPSSHTSERGKEAEVSPDVSDAAAVDPLPPGGGDSSTLFELPAPGPESAITGREAA